MIIYTSSDDLKSSIKLLEPSMSIKKDISIGDKVI